MSKIKPLMPSLREKKRYIVFEIISENPVNNVAKVSNAITDACIEYVGQSGMAKAGLLFLSDKYDNKKQRGIIRVSNKMVGEIKKGLCFVKEIDNNKVMIKSVGVSGILKKAYNNYIAC